MKYYSSNRYGKRNPVLEKYVWDYMEKTQKPRQERLNKIARLVGANAATYDRFFRDMMALFPAGIDDIEDEEIVIELKKKGWDNAR